MLTDLPTTAAHDGQALLREAGLVADVDPRAEHMRRVASPGKPVHERRGVAERLASEPEAVHPAEAPLLGDAAPAHLRKTETPRDRLIAVMKAQGASDRAIAESLQITTATVANTCRQPRIRHLINTIIMEEGRDAVSSILNGAVADSLYKVIDIMNDEKAGARTQLSAAALIQDRVLGKPTQHVDVRTGKLDSDPAELDRQIAEAEVRITHLQGSSKLN